MGWAEKLKHRFLSKNPTPQPRRLEGQRLPFPVEIQYSLTAYCNLKCLMCPREADWIPQGFTRLAGEDREIERFRKLLPLLPTTHHLTLTGGGEPFLDPALYPILEMAAPFENLNVSFNTNATVVTPDRLDRAFAHRVAQLDVSLDSPHPATYEAIRVNARFDKVMRNLKAITEARDRARHRPRISLNMVVMRRNLHEIPDMIRLAADQGLDAVCALYSQIFRRDLMDESLARVPCDEVKALLEKCHRLAQQRGIAFHDLIAEPLGMALFNNPPWETRLSRLCRYPWSNLYVFANGNVRFCCFTSPILGNLDRQSFEDIWYGPKAEEVRRTITDDRYPTECRRCYRWGPEKFDYQPETPGLELDQALSRWPGQSGELSPVLPPPSGEAGEREIGKIMG